MNGACTRITFDLAQALRRLQLEQEPQVLWVDSICINQENLEERAQLAHTIRDIYQSAKRVIVWLGEHADDSHLIFEYIRRCKEYNRGSYFL